MLWAGPSHVTPKSNNAAASTTRGACPLWIPAVSNGLVVGKHTVDKGPGHADATDGTTVRSDIPKPRRAPEGAVYHIYGQIFILIERANGSATHIRTHTGTHIVDEPAVDDLEPAAAYPDGSSAVILGFIG